MANEPTEIRILVIDDDPNIHADFLKCFSNRASDHLSKLEERLFQGIRPNTPAEPNFVVESCSQGFDGYQLVATQIDKYGSCPYTVIFVDMRMPPGWDGLTTVSALLKLKPTLPLVLCTAYSDYSREEIDQRLGKTDALVYLNKPVNPASIRQLAIYFARKLVLRPTG